MAITLTTGGYLKLPDAPLGLTYPHWQAGYVASLDGGSDGKVIVYTGDADVDTADWTWVAGFSSLVRAFSRRPGESALAGGAELTSATVFKPFISIWTGPNDRRNRFGAAAMSIAATSQLTGNTVANFDRFVIGAKLLNSTVSGEGGHSVAEIAYGLGLPSDAVIDQFFAKTIKAEQITGCIRAFPLKNGTDLTSTDGLATLTKVGTVNTSSIAHPVFRPFTTNFDDATDGTAGGLVSVSGDGLVRTAASISVTPISGLKIVSASNEGAGSVYTAGGAIGDQAVRFATRIATLSSASYRALGPVVRANVDFSNHYRGVLETNGTSLKASIQLYSTGGTNLISSTNAFAPAPSDIVHMELKAIGTLLTFRCWLNSNTPPTAAVSSATEVYVSATNSTHTTGFGGMRHNGTFNHAIGDNFVFTDGSGGEDYFYPLVYKNNFEAEADSTLPAGWAYTTGAGMLALITSAFSKPSVSGTKAIGRQNTGDYAVYSAKGLMGNQVIRSATKLASVGISHLLRSNDSSSNAYRCIYAVDGSGFLTTTLTRYQVGTTVLSAAFTTALQPAANDIIHMESRAIDSVLEMRIWLNSTARPSNPTATATDATFATGYPGLIHTGAVNSQFYFTDDVVITNGSGGEDYFYPASVDTTVPVMTGTLISSGVSATGYTIDWSGTTRSDNTAITGYQTSADGATWVDAGNVTSKAFTGKTASTLYPNYVRAYDAAGNFSTPALTLNVTTSAAAGDVTAPNLSGSITQGAITSTSSVMSWPAATDNVAVANYEVSKDSGATWVVLANNVLTYTWTGLTPSTVYGQRVRAKDAAGNISAVLSASVTTSAASVNRTYTPTRVLKAVADGAVAANVAIKAFVHDMTTGALVGTKTGLTTSAAGLPPAFTDTFGVAGTAYDVKFVDAANSLRRSLEVITPTA